MTVQPPAERPAPGYYPDPSIPGFVRYWDGDAWTPGSARPAPVDGAPLPPPPRAAWGGGLRVAPPPPPRPAPSPEETGPVFLDETGAARLIVPPAPQVPAPAPLPAPQQQPDASVWGASAQAQPGLLDSGSFPHHVSWGIAGASVETGAEAGGETRAETTAGTDQDEELASALRLALSQTRRAQLPPLTRYEADSRSEPDDAHSVPTPRGVGAGWGSTPEPEATWAPPTGLPGGGTAPHELHEPYEPRALGAGVGAGAGASAGQTPSLAAPTADPGTEWAARGSSPAVARAISAPVLESEPTLAPRGSGSAGTGAAQALGAEAVQPTVARSTQARRTAVADIREAAVQPARPTQAGRAEASGAKAGQKRARATRPALLGPRIGARLVDTVITYALVGVLAVVLVQRVALHLQAKIDAAQASGVPQTVWLVDGTVLADAGLLLAALLAVGLVYETIPLAVWGRTLGKAMFGLTVLDARSKARPKLIRTLLRTAMCQTLVFLLLGILELVPAATDRKLRQSWHDKLGGTFVVKLRG